MEECEFKDVCDDAYEERKDCVFIHFDEIKACDDRKTFIRLFNSPQFRKKYTTWKNCESIRDTARQDGIAFGQQNPDPKKYVLREGLVKELKKKMVWGRYDCQLIMDIIRTHGLED